jgi:protein O-GlcNAc transferase
MRGIWWGWAVTDARISPDVLLQQASVWQQDGDTERAEAAYRRVLSMDPTNADAMNLLALVHHEHGDREQAIRLLRAAISIHPAARYYTNLGVILAAHGDRTGSVAAYRQAVAHNAKSMNAWPGVIFSMDLHPHASPETRLADRRAFNAQHCAALTAAAVPHTNRVDPERRLRVGYISADFRDHSASMVFSPVLAGHDHEAVEVYCYWQQESEPDEITERIRGYADHWRVVNMLSDDALAELIRADEIDVLVDLSGYSNGNRLLMLARKPAPIIMTGWGHVTGLGIDASDYILADAVCAPPEHAGLYHERVLHLPCVVAYDAREPYPGVVAPPAQNNGHITFGYLGRANKTSDTVWAAWAEILRRVPHSRLILKGADYLDTAYRARVAEFFVSLRISSHRVEMRGPTPRAHHMSVYGEIDIALDPFPQGGGVTTLESCLMGVPSVALLGDYLNARIAPSILTTLGHSEMVAASVPEYVDLAVQMAERGTTLRDRMRLRQTLLSSVICDARGYARNVEAAYRAAWRDWCSTEAANGAGLYLVSA